MNRKDVLEQKQAEIQHSLEEWVREEGVLGPREQIFFSLRIGTVSLVQMEDQSNDIRDMPINLFFTHERMEQVGLGRRLPLRSYRNPWTRAGIETVGALLDFEGYHIRLMGPKKLQHIQTMLEAIGLSLPAPLHEKIKRPPGETS